MSDFFGGRRTLLKFGGVTILGSVLGLLGFAPSARAIVTRPTPESILADLMAGNERFMTQHSIDPHRSLDRIHELSQGQNPIVTILSCADSRVPAEILFDQGLGDIFNVRVAGNIVTPEVLASLEFAVGLLETPLLMVLGHERCGAVTAAVKHQPVPGHISNFIDEILPAVKQTENMPGDPIANAVNANIQLQITQLLQQSELISDRQNQGLVQVVAARYDLDSGAVSLL
jgi:carbonic anhydrase